MQGRPWLTRGPVRGMEWGPPRSVCNGVTGGGGFDSVRRGARGPVRPHQLHRPKDGPVSMNNLFLFIFSVTSLVHFSDVVMHFCHFN